MKETRFFDDDHLYKQGLQKYEEFFTQHSQKQVLGEYSPSYIHHEKALQRIKKHFPDIKLVITFRDPAEKIRSEYEYNKVSGTGSMIQYNSLKQAIEQRRSLIERARHGKNLERVYQYFTPSQVFVGLFRDLKTEPENYIQSIFQFLDVEPDFVPKKIDTKDNATGEKRLRSPFFARTISMVSEIIKQYPHVQQFLEYFGGQQIRNKILNMNKTTDESHEKQSASVDAGTSQLIKEKLIDDIEKLEHLLEKDLSSWK